MKSLIRPLACLTACVVACSVLLGGCEDKHEPVKPTVATQPA